LHHLVIPDLDQTVVRSRDQVRLVTAVVVVDTVDALLVTFQREVRRTGAEVPDLYESTWHGKHSHSHLSHSPTGLIQNIPNGFP